jgi:outer membrane scaffolding protein for murein synthesis (MipA/OmpV family)
MRLTLFAALALTAAPALAQSAPATGSAVPMAPVAPDLPDPNDRRNTLTLGFGAAIHPDYEGSDDYRIIPGAVIRARVNGIAITSNGTYVSADVIDTGRKLDLDAGPIVGVRLNRTGKVHDMLVKRLPDRKVAIEVGGFAGVTLKGLTNPYDQLSFKVEAVRDVGKAHRSTVITPGVSFATPLSRTLYAGLSASADCVQNRYADYYFGVTPADTLVSSLRTYNPRGGYKNWQVGALVNKSLTGDLTRGASLFGLASYKRLVRDFKRSPLVTDRGTAGQWFVGAGAGYTW